MSCTRFDIGETVYYWTIDGPKISIVVAIIANFWKKDFNPPPGRERAFNCSNPSRDDQSEILYFLENGDDIYDHRAYGSIDEIMKHLRYLEHDYLNETKEPQPTIIP